MLRQGADAGAAGLRYVWLHVSIWNTW